MSKSAPLFVRKHLGSLRPADTITERAFQGLKAGDLYRIEIKRPRNVSHHRKYWALLSEVVNNMDNPVAPETLHDLVKLRTGYVETIKTKSGIVQVPSSTSFERMDQTQFERFYDDAIRFIITEVMPGVGSDELAARIEEILGGR